MLKTLVSVALTIIAMTPIATAEPLRVMSWNIANLASAPGHSLRGYVRAEADYDAVRKYIQRFNPDIIALQEMGSLAAARAVVGDDYEVAAETRCLQNSKRCEADVGDIFTAVAFKRALKERVTVFQLDQLAIEHRDSCGVRRHVRGSVGVRLHIGEQVTWIPSLHLKASCKSGSGIKGETEIDCATQREQFRLLREWMQSLPPEDAVILTGDFNRRLAKTSDEQVRRPFFDAYERPRQFLPDGGRRYCWSRNAANVDLRDEKHVREALEANPSFDRQGVLPHLYDPWEQRNIDFFIVENLSSATKLKSWQIAMRGDYALRAIGSETLKTCDGAIKPTSRKKVDPRDGQKKPTTFAFSQAFPSDHCPIALEIEAP